MQLEILSPEKSIFKGKVYGVQLPGQNGYFEILQNHAPLIASLGKGRIKVILDRDGMEFFDITGGFVEVLRNHTSVLVEGAEPLD